MVGVTDHGFVHSIYFFDPNGIRLELTTENLSDQEARDFKASAHGDLAAWSKEKAERAKRRRPDCRSALLWSAGRARLGGA